MKVIKIINMNKSYQDNIIFDKFNFEVEENTFNVVMGVSGSGKSTLLNIIGLLDKADSGDVILFGEKNIKPFSRKAEKMLREKIGYLFQNFALVENETVEYNLKLALDNIKADKKEKIKEVLKEVQLEGYENKKIYKCSGGEQQRVAIARLLLKQCDLILADEPTGSLDESNREIIIKLLKRMQDSGKTIVVVSHDPVFKDIADQIIYLN
ncbi:putative bacteriocin export ABC transporter [Thomasclavelia cocleata]|mgnify:CR=1 FL=1|jgi:putative ABC transport system ATP-binding protein|uniref:Putative ABC transport system ATP-binding protein n=3 Tax=Thomasclavelia cocleata TaxID=69824 RepID=A0A1I0E167_9FIRM|nr:putative bacteriocin export ABC transporter [Thomasclavelia cocleata]MCI9130611.1 putative bacteriocin export ABC transporter [Thomasclavelia cocleata]MCI9629577.1 putative bacteriocin export ABC transporter [Thomasclavelia cocleata]MCR1960253.1 putative bacteriocin export ABC transporter [Thomasclavelia cocleata]NDO42780.1 ATP-binding cassette domain-containing protein [Thomasclavelia cocleata]SET38791.1 putative ABC transport system ATP-binding protein [Thomasclavelia cocleata]